STDAAVVISQGGLSRRAPTNRICISPFMTPFRHFLSDELAREAVFRPIAALCCRICSNIAKIVDWLGSVARACGLVTPLVAVARNVSGPCMMPVTLPAQLVRSAARGYLGTGRIQFSTACGVERTHRSLLAKFQAE